MTSMEDDLRERQPQWKMTLKEDDLNGEDVLNGRRSRWKMTSIKDDLNGTRL